MRERHVVLRYEFADLGLSEVWARWLDCLIGGEVCVEMVAELETGGPGWAVVVYERASKRGKGGGHGS